MELFDVLFGEFVIVEFEDMLDVYRDIGNFKLFFVVVFY